MSARRDAAGALVDDAEFECSECGHLHWTGKRYVACPLAGEGCTCPHGADTKAGA